MPSSEAVNSQTNAPICKLCCTEFNASNKRPRMLGCGHTFSEKCIKDTLIKDKALKTGLLKCPICKKKTVLSKSLEQGLPLNDSILSLLQNDENTTRTRQPFTDDKYHITDLMDVSRPPASEAPKKLVEGQYKIVDLMDNSRSELKPQEPIVKRNYKITELIDGSRAELNERDQKREPVVKGNYKVVDLIQGNRGVLEQRDPHPVGNGDYMMTDVVSNRVAIRKGEKKSANNSNYKITELLRTRGTTNNFSTGKGDYMITDVIRPATADIVHARYDDYQEQSWPPMAQQSWPPTAQQSWPPSALQSWPQTVQQSWPPSAQQSWPPSAQQSWSSTAQHSLSPSTQQLWSPSTQKQCCYCLNNPGQESAGKHTVCQVCDDLRQQGIPLEAKCESSHGDGDIPQQGAVNGDLSLFQRPANERIVKENLERLHPAPGVNHTGIACGSASESGCSTSSTFSDCNAPAQSTCQTTEPDTGCSGAPLTFSESTCSLPAQPTCQTTEPEISCSTCDASHELTDCDHMSACSPPAQPTCQTTEPEVSCSTCDASHELTDCDHEDLEQPNCESTVTPMENSCGMSSPHTFEDNYSSCQQTAAPAEKSCGMSPATNQCGSTSAAPFTDISCNTCGSADQFSAPRYPTLSSASPPGYDDISIMQDPGQETILPFSADLLQCANPRSGNSGGSRVQQLQLLTKFGKYSEIKTQPGGFQAPTRINLSRSNKILVVDPINMMIHIFCEGQCITFFKAKDARGACFIGDDDLLVIATTHGVDLYEANGTFRKSIPLDQAVTAVTYRDGFIIVHSKKLSLCNDHRVCVFKTIAGTRRESSLRLEHFKDIKDVAITNENYIVVLDIGTKQVSVTNHDGFIKYTIDLASNSTVGSLLQPFGVAADSANNIVISDWGNNRIVAFGSSGTLSWEMLKIDAAVTPGEPFNTNAVNVSDIHPYGVAIDKSNNRLFVVLKGKQYAEVKMYAL